MTEETFEKEMSEVLENFDKQLAGIIRSVAWNDGHAYGYPEILAIANDLAYNFEPINARLKGEKCPQ